MILRASEIHRRSGEHLLLVLGGHLRRLEQRELITLAGGESGNGDGRGKARSDSTSNRRSTH
jgi:hypothetical protein